MKQVRSSEKFDVALSDAFEDAPDYGAFGEIDVLSERRGINEILEMARDAEADNFNTEKAADNAPKRHSGKVLLLASAAAVFVAVSSGVVFHYFFSASPSADSPNGNWFGEVQDPGNALFMGETLAVRNAPIPVNEMIRVEEGTAMLRLPTGIEWHMKKQAGGKIAPITATRLKVHLQSGENWFRVDPSRKGPAFSVETPLGEIHVTGTIFVVNVSSGDVAVTLLKGGVWIALPSGKRVRLEAGHTLQLQNGTQINLSKETLTRYREELVSLAWENQQTARPHPPAEPSPAKTSAEKTDVALKAAQRSEASSAVMTQARLLKEIRKQRQQRNWGKVANLYKRLIHMAPRSETAIVSRVSLGEVYLTKLNRHGEALGHFNIYLRSGHTALLPEAAFGRCNAIKGLGKRAQEIKCLEKFVTQYPNAFQTPDAQIRLKALH